MCDGRCSRRYPRGGLVSVERQKPVRQRAKGYGRRSQIGGPGIPASISLVEVIYLVEKGKLPAVVLDRLTEALSEPDSSFLIASLDLPVTLALPQIPRDVVRDMPDRIIAATALYLGLPLVTRDPEISKAGIRTIW